MESREKRIIQLLLALSALVVIIGMFIPVMEVDAAQYASISRQMWEEGSYLEIHHRDLNYLDKPPLLFWLSALSMGVFGFNDFAYKLPSVLFSVLGAMSLFRLGRRFYSEHAAWYAVLLYTTCAGFFVFNSDIRTDTLLISLLVISLDFLTAYRQDHSWKNLLISSVAVALAMMAKGPLGLIFPMMALGPDVVLRRQWKYLFNWKWIPALMVVLLLLFPMCYGLYTQFDANPEAMVNGEKGVSGLRFYFWTQSFGRITGDSVWATQYSNNPDPFFLTTTLLWAFLPWTPVFIIAFFRTVYQTVRFRKYEGVQKEWISLFAILLPLLALSQSGYQLNHYIYIALPFAALMTAGWLDSLDKTARWVKVMRWVYLVVMFLGTLLVAWWLCSEVFPGKGAHLWLLGWLFPLALLFWYSGRIIETLGAVIVAFFLMMNGFFYPRLLHYQAAAGMVEVYQAKRNERSRLYHYGTGTSHTADFRNNEHLPLYWVDKCDSLSAHFDLWVYTSKPMKDTLLSRNEPWEIVDSFEFYPVTQLGFRFLNPLTRNEVIEHRYLLHCKNH